MIEKMSISQAITLIWKEQWTEYTKKIEKKILHRTKNLRNFDLHYTHEDFFISEYVYLRQV